MTSELTWVKQMSNLTTANEGIDPREAPSDEDVLVNKDV